jgi:hypothetical protein
MHRSERPFGSCIPTGARDRARKKKGAGSSSALASASRQTPSARRDFAVPRTEEPIPLSCSSILRSYWSSSPRTLSTRDRPFGPLSLAASRRTMWKPALRPQRCLISICISGFAPRSSRLVLSVGPGRVSSWQPPVPSYASSAGTSVLCQLRFRASNRTTRKHARVDLGAAAEPLLGHFAMRMRGLEPPRGC